jgi:gamma-glutamyltranspeptidase/glutathione hydrolase
MNGDRPLVASVHGMVAAAHPLAASAGAQILRDGGNAFDAAVATAAALNVVEPFMSGIAGLGMACVYSASEARVRCIDFVPPTPRNLDPASYSKEDCYLGARASGVPGNLVGWHCLSREYGLLEWSHLLAPAIRLAADGFPVTGGIPTITPEYWPLRSRDPEWVRVYTPGHADVESGWILRQTDLARTLASIAADGPAAFYHGRIGETVVNHLQQHGGVLSMQDLESVDPQWADPLHTHYSGLQVHSLAPPTEAFQFLLTLAILEQTNLQRFEPNSAEHLDQVFRAIRLAAEARIQHNRCDPQTAFDLLHGKALDALCESHRNGAAVSGRTQQWKPITDPELVGRREHTTSLSTADADGNMVCITQSLGSIYGSGVVVPGTGICMNNFLNWTDLDPQSPNRLSAGQSMSMCLAPSISLRDNQPVLALGTPGSYGILQTQVQVMVQQQDYQQPLNHAIDAPRARLWDGDLIYLENRIEPLEVQKLRRAGHHIQLVDPYTRVVGGVQAIERQPATGALLGAADARRDGCAVAP